VAERRPDGTFAENNEGYLKHGGEGAVKAIQHGTPHTGLAAEAELAVYEELEDQGRYAIVVRNAARVQAAADLYWNAVATAAEDKDLEALDRYIKRYGWLAGVSLRAWAQVKAEQPEAAAYTIDMALEAVREARREQN